jgi:hypothetical protein
LALFQYGLATIQSYTLLLIVEALSFAVVAHAMIAVVLFPHGAVRSDLLERVKTRPAVHLRLRLILLLLLLLLLLIISFRRVKSIVGF